MARRVKPKASSPMSFDPTRDYPLGSRRPDLVSTLGGTPLAEVTLEAVRDGRISAPRRARDAGDAAPPGGGRARRGARSRSPRTSSAPPSWRWCPTSELLEIYTALRPGRSTAAQLEAWAGTARRLRGGAHRGVRAGGGGRLRAARAARTCVAGASRPASGGSSVASCSCRRIPSSASSPPTGRTIPSRSSSSRTASSCAWTAARRADFDVIDRFVVAHGLDLEVAARGDGARRPRARAHARRRRRAAGGARAPRARA